MTYAEMSRCVRPEHLPRNAMIEADEIERFHDRCIDLMRELLDGLAAAHDRSRPFPEIEAAIGWPRRRIASVLGGVSQLRHTEFGGLRPYHFHNARHPRPAAGSYGWTTASQCGPPSSGDLAARRDARG